MARGVIASSAEAAAMREPGEPEQLPSDGEGSGAYFEVEGLEELPKREWLFTNELVSKQERGARYFMPRAPVLVRLPD